ncbi:MAG: hypothetical protein KDA37_14450, partial [Planctomycetales bacterium]|nr:hypothetical protein [Planctomycetales bacterium]
MTRPRASLTALVLLTTALPGVWREEARAADPVNAISAENLASRTSTPSGWSTCSNTNCHGGVLGPTFRQSFSIWATDDPHSGAYWVLYGKDSRRMVRTLSPATTTEPDYQAYVDEHCAICHASLSVPESRSLDVAGTPQPVIASPDVGCGSCHGDPTNWLEDHFKPTARDKSKAVLADTEQREWAFTNHDYGLIAMDDELTRARVCVGCHVGSAGGSQTPRREVNHDLIAAGHPRLAFEYTSHLANLPRHWSEPEVVADPVAKPWAIGQLVAADAALEL